MSRAVFWGLIMLVALAPLPLASDRPLPWSVLALVVGLLLIGWAIAGARNRPEGSRIADRYLLPLALVFAAAIAWCVMQITGPLPPQWQAPEMMRMQALLGAPPAAGLSLTPAAGWTIVLRLLAYAGVFFLAWEYGRERRDAMIILISVAVAAFVYAVYGLLVQLGSLDSVLWYAKTAYRDSVTGPFVSRNSFATYLGLGLLIALAIAYDVRPRARQPARAEVPAQNRRRGRAAMLGLIATTLAIGLLMTRSRGGFYSTGIALLLSGLFLVASGALRGRALLLSVGLGGAIFAALLVVGGKGLAGRLEQEGASIEAGRGAIFVPTLAALRERPLQGYGLGSFRGVYEAVNDGRIYEQGFFVDKAHNSYLEMALEAGVPATAGLLIVLLGCTAPCALALARDRARPFAVAGIACAILVAVHAAVDFSLEMPAVACAFVLVLGAAGAQSLQRLHQPWERR